IRPVTLGELVLLDVRTKAALARKDPHLYELHLGVLPMVALGVLSAGAEAHTLHTARQEHAAVSQAVAMLELAGDDEGDALDVAMRVHRPHGAGDERVVIEHAQRADAHVLRIAIPVEREVPTRAEP